MATCSPTSFLSAAPSPHYTPTAMLGTSSGTQPLEIWHMRLGHLNERAIRHLVTKSTGMTIGPASSLNIHVSLAYRVPNTAISPTYGEIQLLLFLNTFGHCNRYSESPPGKKCPTVHMRYLAVWQFGSLATSVTLENKRESLSLEVSNGLLLAIAK